ncbi:unnamed protein product, partial [Didymodactylos carnosus]
GSVFARNTPSNKSNSKPTKSNDKQSWTPKIKAKSKKIRNLWETDIEYDNKMDKSKKETVNYGGLWVDHHDESEPDRSRITSSHKPGKERAFPPDTMTLDRVDGILPSPTSQAIAHIITTDKRIAQPQQGSAIDLTLE